MPSSSLPRLELSEFSPTLAAALEPRLKRLGYLGEFFQCCAHQPRALAAFIELTESSQDGLSKRLAELIALTCSTSMGNDYERNQHERLSVRLGFGRDWVAAVNALQPQADSALTSEERSIQRLTLAVLETGGKAAGGLFEEAVRSLGPRAAMAILMMIGRCVAHGLIVNTLELAPPVPSIFQDGFNGTSAR
ncbi:MAG TPA: carboxymuconolactone decarboxylase family protein [Steroidobacteraceae bacterium]|nr:carboxymuconolactone decarboxylase family protein [Steroidobacteraceae bacterium]